MQRILINRLPMAARAFPPSAMALPRLPCTGTWKTCVVRLNSTSSESAAAAKSRIPSWLSLTILRKYAPQIAVGTGALVVVYGLSKMMVYITTSLLSLDMYDVFYYGMATGVVGALTAAAGGLYLWNISAISTRAAFRRTMALVQNSAVATRALGTNIRSGELRAFRVFSGHLSLASKMAWVEPRAQLMIQVSGDKGEGVVSAEAVKHKGRVVLNLVALDVLGKGGNPPELHILQGSEEKLHVRGLLRGFMQLERAQYVAQDKVEDDNTRLVEQERLPSDDAPLK